MIGQDFYSTSFTLIAKCWQAWCFQCHCFGIHNQWNDKNPGYGVRRIQDQVSGRPPTIWEIIGKWLHSLESWALYLENGMKETLGMWSLGLKWGRNSCVPVTEGPGRLCFEGVGREPSTWLSPRILWPWLCLRLIWDHGHLGCVRVCLVIVWVTVCVCLYLLLVESEHWLGLVLGLGLTVPLRNDLYLIWSCLKQALGYIWVISDA
jgi:hypothetical protein